MTLKYKDYFDRINYQKIYLEGSMGLNLLMTRNELLITIHSKPSVSLSKETLETAELILFDENVKEVIIEYKKENKTKYIKFIYQCALFLGESK